MSGVLTFQGSLGESQVFTSAAQLGGKGKLARGWRVLEARGTDWQGLSRCQGEETEEAVFEKPEVFPFESLAATQSHSLPWRRGSQTQPSAMVTATSFISSMNFSGLSAAGSREVEFRGH